MHWPHHFHNLPAFLASHSSLRSLDDCCSVTKSCSTLCNLLLGFLVPDRNFLKSFLWKWYSEEINRNMTWCTMSGCLKRPLFRIWDREFEKWFSFPFAKHRIMESQYWRETWGRLLIRKKLATTLISSNREIIHYASHTPWTNIASEGCSYEKSYSKIIQQNGNMSAL